MKPCFCSPFQSSPPHAIYSKIIMYNNFSAGNAPKILTGADGIMKPEKIDKIHATDASWLFRQATITFSTISLTCVDMIALSLVALLNPVFQDEATLGILFVFGAICLVLNFIPVVLSRMHEDLKCGLSRFSRKEFRRKCIVSLTVMGILFVALIAVRMSSVTVPSTKETASSTSSVGQFDIDNDEPDEESEVPVKDDGVQAENSIPFSAYVIAFILSLEPMATSVFNYMINSYIYNPYESRRHKSRKALRAVEKRMAQIQGDEYLLSVDSKEADLTANNEKYRTFTNRLSAQRTEAELTVRQTLAEAIHASPDQIDNLLPSPADDTETEDEGADVA